MLPSYGQTLLRDCDFKVTMLARTSANSEPVAVVKTIRGNERSNNSLNRLSTISENQYLYPEPDSGCGPIALLNILVWYEKYGLIQPLFNEADPVLYKRKLFAEIDQRILNKSKMTRSERAGTRNIDAALVMNEIVHQQSAGQLYLHSDYLEAPIELSEFLDAMPNFRAGYLIGFPKDRSTGKLYPLHAMAVIRADRAGYITIATWGKKPRGLLRKRNGEQWFIPQDPNFPEIKLVGMMRFIPFEPITPEDPEPQS